MLLHSAVSLVWTSAKIAANRKGIRLYKCSVEPGNITEQTFSIMINYNRIHPLIHQRGSLVIVITNHPTTIHFRNHILTSHFAIFWNSNKYIYFATDFRWYLTSTAMPHTLPKCNGLDRVAKTCFWRRGLTNKESMLEVCYKTTFGTNNTRRSK